MRFEEELEALREGAEFSPIVVAANFGAGKSHLLEYLQTLGERDRCVTSYVVVSPEMPLGNPMVVLRPLRRVSRRAGTHR